MSALVTGSNSPSPKVWVNGDDTPSNMAYAPATSIQHAPLSGKSLARASTNSALLRPSVRSRRRASARSDNSMGVSLAAVMDESSTNSPLSGRISLAGGSVWYHRGAASESLALGRRHPNDAENGRNDVGISLVCHSCANRLEAPDTHAGRKVRCPECGVMCPVPTAPADAG